MSKLKVRTTLISADLLGIPLDLQNESRFIGNGVGKSFAKFTTKTEVSGRLGEGVPVALPTSPFSSTGQRVLIYIKNTSTDATEYVTLLIKNTVTAATLNGLSCATECTADYVHYIPFSQIPAGGVIVLPFAGHDALYIDATSGTPEIEYLVMEE
tara:strand:+ start:1067 stop:1531 length:465 start_codon:yes stop_codon:yes gene_type:complete